MYRMKHTDNRVLLTTGHNSSNLVEMVPAEPDATGLLNHDWSGPYYLFLREGQGAPENFRDIYVAGPMSFAVCSSRKRELVEKGLVKYWNENLRQFLPADVKLGIFEGIPEVK